MFSNISLKAYHFISFFRVPKCWFVKHIFLNYNQIQILITPSLFMRSKKGRSETQIPVLVRLTHMCAFFKILNIQELVRLGHVSACHKYLTFSGMSLAINFHKTPASSTLSHWLTFIIHMGQSHQDGNLGLWTYIIKKNYKGKFITGLQEFIQTLSKSIQGVS